MMISLFFPFIFLTPQDQETETKILSDPYPPLPPEKS